jgi:hypothetical protein
LRYLFEEMYMNDQTMHDMDQFLTTEHAALQAARCALVLEGNGRTASFLTTISAGIVALPLVFQISRFGEAFLLFALVRILILGFVGISAYVRMVQLDLADLVYTSAINRIRHYYLEAAPEMTRYLSFPAFDDAQSVSRARVIYTSFAWTVLSYPSGLILVINSLLAGALASLLVGALFQIQLWLAAGVGLPSSCSHLLLSITWQRSGSRLRATISNRASHGLVALSRSCRPQRL